jgi:hypothetical protein
VTSFPTASGPIARGLARARRPRGDVRGRDAGAFYRRILRAQAGVADAPELTSLARSDPGIHRPSLARLL